jgi:hypothetical protein
MTTIKPTRTLRGNDFPPNRAARRRASALSGTRSGFAEVIAALVAERLTAPDVIGCVCPDCATVTMLAPASSHSDPAARRR